MKTLARKCAKRVFVLFHYCCFRKTRVLCENSAGVESEGVCGV